MSKFLLVTKEIEVNTPYGKPSSPLTVGKIKGIDVVILARHGRKHTIPPIMEKLSFIRLYRNVITG